MSDLLPLVITALREKTFVDTKEELDDLYKRVETATSIEVIHEATSIPRDDDADDIVVYASEKFEDGYFSENNTYWEVPLNNDNGPTTCKLKDLEECYICVGGGFTIQTLYSGTVTPTYGWLDEDENNGKIKCSMFLEGYIRMWARFSIDGWPKEEWEPVVRAADNDPVNHLIQYLRDTVANNHPEATARFTLLSFAPYAIQGPLKRVVIEKQKQQVYLSEFSDTFLHGIPDNIPTFVTEIILEKVVPAVGNNEVPVDVLKNVFSFGNRFSKEEYNVLFYGQPIIGGKEEFFKGLEDVLVRDANIRFNGWGLASNEFSLKVNTNYGHITFNIFDGRRLGPGVRAGADCAILNFETRGGASFRNIRSWHRELTRACGNIPIVACGNTVSDDQEAVMNIFGTVYENMFLDIRTESEKPFLLLANWLNGFLAHPKINFLRPSPTNSEEESAAVRQP